MHTGSEFLQLFTCIKVVKTSGDAERSPSSRQLRGTASMMGAKLMGMRPAFTAYVGREWWRGGGFGPTGES